MIFYFSASGNSKQAADMLVKYTKDQVVNIGKAWKNEQFQFDLDENESLGFVFPVYFWGVPSIVLDFIREMEINGVPKYTYILMTCGSSTGQTGKMLAKLLAEKNILLDATFAVAMPDTYVVMFDVASKDEEAKILKKSEESLAEIAQSVLNLEKQKNNKLQGKFPKKYISYITYPLYNHIYRKTKRFSVNDNCNFCGICQKICPINAIKLVDGKPEWIVDKCVHCLACLHHCPTKAINNGKSEKMGRYINPNVDFDLW